MYSIVRNYPTVVQNGAGLPDVQWEKTFYGSYNSKEEAEKVLSGLKIAKFDVSIEYTETSEDTTYNGWKNYETWNVALWIQNDYPLYCIAREFAKWDQPFLKLRQELKESTLKYVETSDGVSLWDRCLDIGSLDSMLNEINS